MCPICSGILELSTSLEVDTWLCKRCGVNYLTDKSGRIVSAVETGLRENLMEAQRAKLQKIDDPDHPVYIKKATTS